MDTPNTPARTMPQAIQRLIARIQKSGWQRLALYGAGQHTQRLLTWLRQGGCVNAATVILDDHRAGTTLAGLEVVAPTRAAAHHADAIIISSDAFEEVLYQKALALQLAIPIVRIYGAEGPAVDLQTQQLLERISGLPADMHSAGTMMREVLHAMARLTQGMELNCTAETGSGKTTLLLAHLSKHHIVFSIDEGNRSIASVKSSPLFNARNVEWVEGPTQLTLPKYQFTQPLDFALIDGPHAYPFPDMEYMYFYPHLRTGALLAVDDIHIPTITNLFNFLKEEEMFELVEVVMTTAFFRRTSKLAFPTTYDGWWWQHYNRAHFPIHEHPYLKETLSSDTQAGIKRFYGK